MKRVALIIGAILIGLVVSGSPVDAMAATSPGTASPNMSISVSPTRVVIPENPGKTTYQAYTIHAGAAPIKVGSSVLPFTQNGQGKSVGAQVPIAVSGANWIKTPAPFVIAARASKTVTVAITEPKTEQVGQKYLAVLWTMNSLQKTTGKGAHMDVSGSVAGELILNGAPGTATDTTVFGLKVPSIVWGRTASVTATAHDTGNSYNLLNAQHVTVNGSKQNLNGELLLSGTKQSQTISVPLSWGSNTVSYNGSSQKVWAVPGEFIAMALGFIVLVLGVWILASRNATRRARKTA